MGFLSLFVSLFVFFFNTEQPRFTYRVSNCAQGRWKKAQPKEKHAQREIRRLFVFVSWRPFSSWPPVRERSGKKGKMNFVFFKKKENAWFVV